MRKIVILPNAITAMNLLFGVFSLMFIYNDDHFAASICIFSAMLCDLMDGQVARYHNATSKFGLEFDSLSDLVSFGVAPGMLVFTYALKEMNELGIFIASAYILACGLRLARFNVSAQSSGKKSFSGLPSPAAAGVVCSTLMISLIDSTESFYKMLPFSVLLAGILMVSSVKYPVPVGLLIFLKNRIIGLYRILFLAVLMILLFRYTEVMLYITFVGYAAFGLARAILATSHTIAPVKSTLKQFAQRAFHHHE